MFLLYGFAGGQRQGSHGTAVERTIKSDIQLTPRVPSGKFKRRLNRFCSGVAEIDPSIAPNRGQSGQPFRQSDLGRVIKIGSGHMQELLSLVLYCRYDPGMAMPGGIDSDTGSEIKKHVAVHIPDP